MFTIYVVHCRKANHIYVGQTANYEQRIASHQKGTGAKFIQRHGFDFAFPHQHVKTRERAKQIEQDTFRAYLNNGWVVGGCFSSDLMRRNEAGRFSATA